VSPAVRIDTKNTLASKIIASATARHTVLGKGTCSLSSLTFFFSVSLAEKLARHQVQSFSLHPGPIDSGMQAHVPEDAIANALRQRREEAEREGREIKRAKRKTIQQGCATALVAALDPSIAGLSGNYLEDGNVMENSYAIDNENAERLWILSEELVGQKFEWE
jgi:NAD(P)-dependent dehydrogenase (short-subunit alcohol dehydrogenase family)